MWLSFRMCAGDTPLRANGTPSSMKPMMATTPSNGLQRYLFPVARLECSAAHTSALRYDDYWRTWSIADHYRQIAVPAYHVGGWYDHLLRGASTRWMFRLLAP